MVKFGLDLFLEKFPEKLRNKKIGVVCHAASIRSDYSHIIDNLAKHPLCELAAIFGPQHGLFGQTQDNMIEWEGGENHPVHNIPIYSLYGAHRKPTDSMLQGLEALVIDLQDVGARPYTYIWTIKLCMEACQQRGIPVWVLDRPNPVGALPFDGPMLNSNYFTFVGGAEIPLCHQMTMGEMALFLKNEYFPKVELHVVWMEKWWRNSTYDQTGLPWVFPSPNMPTVKTALVYPGMVLLEATNVSEGRGSTIPFELFGAPYINGEALKEKLTQQKIPGAIFREHNFIPTFNKWSGQYCQGMQIHVTDPNQYQSVYTTALILQAIRNTSEEGAFRFLGPPYEYEHHKMPIDILWGDDSLRNALEWGSSIDHFPELWEEDRKEFLKKFQEVSHYPEEWV